MSSTTFNGVSLFAGHTEAAGSTEVIFGGTAVQDNTVSIFTSATGESGSKVSINKTMLLSALTINSNTLASAAFSTAANSSAAGAAAAFSFASDSVSGTMTLDKVSVAVFTQALENIATLRAENGGSVSRLQFSKESAAAQKTNLEAANGRIMDVDIATESTRLAKYNILVQASASMLSQANATSNVAMMLLN
jgi:flagellin